jgi:Tfp pilus assembly protein PilF
MEHPGSNEIAPSEASAAGATDNFGRLLDEARVSAVWGEFHRGYIFFKMALDEAPKDATTGVKAEILEGLEEMQAGMDQVALDLPDLEAAVEVEPDSAEKRFYLALALSKLGKDKESLAEYEAALRNPEGLCAECFRDLWNNIGWFYFRQRNFREALKWFEQTYQIAVSDEIFAVGSCALAIENKILCFASLDMAAEAEAAAREYVRRYGRLAWPERHALARLAIDADGIYVRYRAAQLE